MRRIHRYRSVDLESIEIQKNANRLGQEISEITIATLLPLVRISSYMPSTNRWNLRIENGCLFIDEVDSGRIVLQHNARPGLRPYIHPLRGPDGQTCLTEDSPWHHPWQHGIQTGFHGVNGCDFWFDPGQHADTIIGTIHPSEPRIESRKTPRWMIDAVWRHHDGSELLNEQQIWTLRSVEGVLYLDLDWILRSIPNVQIDQGSYGGLFVRMPYRDERTANVVNSTGLKDDDTEQAPAVWVDLLMPVNRGDVSAGISLLDHPNNPRHPAHWRVDGQRGINPAPCIPGPIHLVAGEALSHRYRLILHDGPLDPDRIQEHWETYASESG